jgi:uncharacterized lipoprotein NlpE involved in copper resistance
MRILLVVILFLVAACGTLPCADCEGIRTTITLREDETFDRERLYLGKSDTAKSDSGGQPD